MTARRSPPAPLGLVLLLTACSLGNEFDADQLPPALPPPDEGVPAWCDDGLDNDNDGATDCDDSDCIGLRPCLEDSAALCEDGVDNDRDGAVDCADPDCIPLGGCLERELGPCANGLDDDLDGDADCADPECRGFQHCLEDTDPACRDGADNDFDGRTDCDDAGCLGLGPCLHVTPVVRDEPCEGVRPGYQLVDDIVGAPDAGAWRQDPDAGMVSQWAMAGPLDGEGISTRTLFGVGAQQPFTARVAYHFDRAEACESVAGACRARLTFAAGGHDGDELIELDLTVAELTPAVACRLHGADAGEGQGLPLDAGGATTLSVILSVTAGDLAVDVQTDGGLQRVCGGIALAQLEPLASLVLRGGGAGIFEDPEGGPFARSHFLIDRVELAVEPAAPPARCAGLRTPLLADRFCEVEDPRSEGITGLKIARGAGGGHSLLLTSRQSAPGDFGVEVRDHLGQALSADGRTGWSDSLRSDTLINASRRAAALVLGAHRYDPDNDSFEAWWRVAPSGGVSPTAWHSRASGENPSSWTTVRPVALESEDTDEWVPEAVIKAEGRYLGWFGAPGPDGLDAIYPAVSDDGAGWRAGEAPVLVAGPERAWDSAGVGRPDVRLDALRGVLVMAYEGRSAGAPAAVGLAVADVDGVWRKHQDNPVIVGETSGLDLAGVENPTLLPGGGGLVVWYIGRTAREVRCDDGRRIHEPTRPAAAELTFEAAGAR